MEMRRINIIKRIIVFLLICLISCTFAACGDSVKNRKLSPINEYKNLYYDVNTKEVFELRENGYFVRCRMDEIGSHHMYWDGCHLITVMEDM